MGSERKKKSVVIPKEDLVKFRACIRKFHTLVDGEEETGISQYVLRNLQTRDTCAPETLEKITQFLKPQKVA